MILVTHILIALGSLVFTGLTYLMPSRFKLGVSYVFVAATLASGTWLVVASRSAILSSCMTGLVYLAVTWGGIILARRKLAD